jgi:hypothetical protein
LVVLRGREVVLRPRIVLDDSTRLHCAASKVKERANIAVIVLYYFNPDSNMSTERKVELESKERRNIALREKGILYI